MTMSNRKFGIEIECTGMSMDAARSVITEAGLACTVEGYGHGAPRHWKIVPDGSVPDGFEVVSPILSGEAGLVQVRTVGRALLAAGAKVDKRCGLHVHVDARDLSGADLISVVKRYAEHESQIDAFMPVSRRLNNNQFCRSMCDMADEFSGSRMASYTPTRLAEAAGSRYYKVNLQSFIRHGSVEFRQHSGTIDSRKMENWIQFCLNFVEASKVTVTRTEETAEASPQRANAIEKKFAKLAELFDLHHDRYDPISASELARALETTESTVISYISQFRARYSAVIKVRRGRGYFKADPRCLADVVGVAVPTVTTSIVIPEERGVFFGLSVEVASYFHERIQDLSQERSNAAPGRAGRAQRLAQEQQAREREAEQARARERDRAREDRELAERAARERGAQVGRASYDSFGNPMPARRTTAQAHWTDLAMTPAPRSSSPRVSAVIDPVTGAPASLLQSARSYNDRYLRAPIAPIMVDVDASMDSSDDNT